MTETLPTAAPESNGRFDLGGRSLRGHAARGVIINGAFTTGLTFLGFARGFIVAALLTPAQFGIWGILATALITLQWLKQAGVGDKYIQQDEADQELAFQKAFTLELIVNAVLVVVLAIVVVLLTIAYGQDELLAPGFALIAVLPAMTLQAPLWILYRRLHFARQRALQAIDPVVAFVVTIVLAATGAGYWSLIIGAIAGAWAAALAILAVSPYRLRLRFDRPTARSYVGFSTPLVVATASGIVIGHSSLLVAESAVGLAAAGAAALAASVSILTNRVDDMITATLYPAVCAVRDKTELLYESFVKSNRLALMWAMPFGLSLTLFAPDLVNFALGEKWQPAIELLQVFGAIAALGHLGFNWAAYFRARGDTVPVAVAAVVTAVVFVALVIPLTYAEGLTGLAISIVVANAAGFAVRAFYLVRLFPGKPFARLALRALAPAVPAVGIVLLARVIESGERTAGTAIAEMVAYLVVFAAATWALERDLIREALGYLRGGSGG
ncbi:MAG: oligosaccharide flippase family protein, partial [Solirubrobacteraceae bacterium]